MARKSSTSGWELRRGAQQITFLDIKGDKSNPEPECLRIRFPWGCVEVVRAQDGVPNPDYWVHLTVNNPHNTNFSPDADSGDWSEPGVIVGARLDQTDKHAADSNLGDFDRRELYHVALKIGRLDYPQISYQTWNRFAAWLKNQGLTPRRISGNRNYIGIDNGVNIEILAECTEDSSIPPHLRSADKEWKKADGRKALFDLLYGGKKNAKKKLKP